MKNYYAMVDGEITPIRVPATEIRNNRWEGYIVGETVEELFRNCGAVIRRTMA